MQPPDCVAPFDPAPFVSTQAAWFAVARAMNTSPIGTDRQVDGVVRCLDRLYRNRRIELLHARILRIWGRRGIAPNPARPNERSDWQIWQEALDRLDGPCARRESLASSLRGRPQSSVQPIPAGTADKASAPGRERGNHTGAGRVDHDQVGPLAIGDLATIVQPGRRSRIG